MWTFVISSTSLIVAGWIKILFTYNIFGEPRRYEKYCETPLCIPAPDRMVVYTQKLFIIYTLWLIEHNYFCFRSG